MKWIKIWENRIDDDDQAEARAIDPNTPLPELIKLSQDPRSKVRFMVAKNTSTPANVLNRILDRAIKERTYGIAEGICENPNVTPQILDKLTRFNSFNSHYIKRRVALHRKTSPKTLERLSREDHISIRQGLALNPEVPAEVLIRLSQDPIEDIRRNVASNPATPAEILDQLSQDPSFIIRSHVAGNHSAPARALMRLIEGEPVYIVHQVAQNPNTPVDALIVLSRRREESIRSAAGRRLDRKIEEADPAERKRIEDLISMTELGIRPTHSDLDLDLLDLGEAVSWEILKDPNASADSIRVFVNHPTSSVRLDLAGHPNAPADVLERLSHDVSDHVRSHVAQHPNCPVHVLVELADDEDYMVKGSVANNENVPLNILYRLCRDRDTEVRARAAKSPKAPSDLLEELSSDEEWRVKAAVAANPKTPRYILQELTVESHSSIRTAVASNPNTSIETLMLLTRDRDWYTRYSLTRNEKSTPEILDVLSKDPEGRVSSMVPHHPNVSIETLVYLGSIKQDEGTAHNARKKIDEYLKTADSEERKRVEDLVSMASLGINTSNGDLDLDSLDLGESYRAIESFQLWESRSREGFKARSERARLSQDPVELDRFSRDKSYQVLIEVAQNPWTPPEALLRIISTTWGFAADLAIKNPNCPEEALWYAADSNSYSMRLELVQLRTAPIEILIYMLKKGDVPGVMKELKNSIHRYMDEHPEDRERIEGIMAMMDLGFKFPEVDRKGVIHPGKDLDLDDLDI